MVEQMKGSRIQIESYKHDGSVHRIWRENTLLKVADDHLIGANDQTEVIEHDGSRWITKEPGIFYFPKNRWFNIIGLVQPKGIHYYCNLSSPYVFNRQALKYIDYDLDVKVYPDLSYHILDRDEFHRNERKMNYPRDLYYILQAQIDTLLKMIHNEEVPFSPNYIQYWYEQYVTHFVESE